VEFTCVVGAARLGLGIRTKGQAPAGFTFVPKHEDNAYTLTADALARMVETAAGAGGSAGAADDGDEGEENG
jgi:hypothetical protein